jgi:8-oxo-dGTP pyrophosphatase MutT (NUDIX family)
MRYRDAEALHKEYKQFVRSVKIKTLLVQGDVTQVWQVFKSLFTFVEAAGGLVLNSKGELLMIYRNRHWDLPKGKMEAGESPAQTAVREVEEECGVRKLKTGKALLTTYHIYFQDKHDCIKCTHWFEMTCKDDSLPVPQKEEGIIEAKWMPVAELKKNLHKIYPSLLEVIHTTFSF